MALAASQFRMPTTTEIAGGGPIETVTSGAAEVFERGRRRYGEDVAATRTQTQHQRAEEAYDQLQEEKKKGKAFVEQAKVSIEQNAKENPAFKKHLDMMPPISWETAEPDDVIEYIGTVWDNIKKEKEGATKSRLETRKVAATEKQAKAAETRATAQARKETRLSGMDLNPKDLEKARETTYGQLRKELKSAQDKFKRKDEETILKAIDIWKKSPSVYRFSEIIEMAEKPSPLAGAGPLRPEQERTDTVEAFAGAARPETTTALPETVAAPPGPAPTPAPSGTGTQADPYKVASEADYNNVPPGSYYMDPNGKLRRKK